MLNCLLALFLTFFAQPDTTLRLPGSVASAPSQLRLCSETDSLQIAVVVFVGNRKTKERVLRAELDLVEGEILTSGELEKRLEKNRLRLYNLQLFHWVRYETVCQAGRVTIIFEVQERWYLFPVPIFSLADRNINAWLEKKDFNRIDYGLHLVQYNFRGRNELLKANIQLGFNRKYELFYTVPYFNKKRNLGFSLGGSIYQSHSLDYTTGKNRLLTLHQDEVFPIQRRYATGSLILRENVQKQTTLTASYHQEEISDSVYQLNPEFFSNILNRKYLELEIARTLNFRNTFAYPLAGHFLQFGLTQQLGLNNNQHNTTAFAKYGRYIPLGKRFYYSYTLEGQSRLASNLAYADNIALGYTSYIRGYELYVIGGQHYGLLKQGLSHPLLDLNQIELKFIRNPKFNRIPVTLYLNWFADAGYTVENRFEQTNFLTNRLNMATGMGLHLVTYYDRVITFEYSVNREGRTGLYIHTTFPF
ncbi:POTRA domain-containing protein [Adhaeribacter soli]|uniref:POTRA domain-containing protein n=1 Tax=Adhaeribacter soli TaxID=2607655 RepID=UPI001783DCEC|nr:POTRA domain-containing protein [Adhaeribacter soli]